MSEHTLEPPELGAELDLSAIARPDGDAIHLTWAHTAGRRVVVKSARGRHRAALRREAQALAHVAGPGVVDLLAVHEADDLTALVLGDAGPRTLADTGQLGSEALLCALAHTCEVVVRLHQQGWSHGALGPEHVIVGPRGRVQLCSLSAARPLGPDGPAADLARLVELATQVAGELEERDRHDARRARRLRAALAAVGEGSAPDVAQLAAALRALVTGAPRSRHVPLTAHLRGRVRAQVPTRSSTGSLPAVLRTTSVTLGLVALGLVVAVAFPRDGSADPVVASLKDPQAPPATAAGRPATDGATDGARPPDAPAAAVPTGDSPTVVVLGRTYRAGLPGDRVAVGDWNCDGEPTVRALRPATGEVFEFASPDTTGRPRPARLLSVHLGSVDLVAEPRPGAPGVCHRSVLVGPDERRQEVP
jgi:hypothetical protein